MYSGVYQAEAVSLCAYLSVNSDLDLARASTPQAL